MTADGRIKPPVRPIPGTFNREKALILMSKGILVTPYKCASHAYTFNNNFLMCIEVFPEHSRIIVYPEGLDVLPTVDLWELYIPIIRNSD